MNSYEVARIQARAGLRTAGERQGFGDIDRGADRYTATGQFKKHGPTPKLLQQVERIQRLPKTQQCFIMQMIDTVQQQGRQSA